MQHSPEKAPMHVAIIMDGNGRWATRRGLPRTAGHAAGVRSVRTVVEAAAQNKVGTLTLYAFSSDNWKRPEAEVAAIMRLLARHLHIESQKFLREGIRLTVIGRRDRLPKEVLKAIKATEALTRQGTALHLRLAVDYSSRDALACAAQFLNGDGHYDVDTIKRALAKAYHTDTLVPDVDLLIRTGGEQRLSDFLLWESAYAELYFTRCWWPDFGEAALCEALEEFQSRQRRFGGLVRNGIAS